MIEELSDAVVEASRVRIRRPMQPKPHLVAPQAGRSGQLPGERVVAIGASTGGTTALNSLIPALPPNFPPTLVVQHMPPVFTRMFAEALGRMSQLRVREAQEGDRLEQGLVLVAPGDMHVRVVKEGGIGKIRLGLGEKVSGHRPSVDVLFSSLAQAYGAKAVGVLMTGMGRDGADGLLEMRRAGARCIAQDEESSVVFGMPKEAWKNGAAEALVDLDELPGALNAILHESIKEVQWRQ